MIEGGCNCGKIRYSSEAKPIAVAQCHCRNCQRQSGSAFSVNLLFPAATLLVSGEPAAYEDTDTESGNAVVRKFCSTCGSPLFSETRSNPALIIVKAGTLDNPGAFKPGISVWTDSQMPWVELPAGQTTFPRNAG
ncbi:GFA family protein [Novosphingobium taihuense]|uniref:CENP-V/GFA domain-containing protein n=1 Tax=Novosphingobium taihuense TaxID=260085 RepID=A0A7W7ETM6_9SPHN|nr:GFA family protein [Novosphingobium taihuense]MBB4613036.1 hypothetical protein [Novosphingobium taihuense]TWH85180.1 hypothetical protein IQ25_01934 [Novosphingobium taihuense]